MTGNRTSPLIILSLFLVALIVAQVNGRVFERLQRSERVNRVVVEADIPPALAMTTMAAGPMRGLVANGLWWRAVRLQDEGNYYEAIQLGSWITALQPTLYKVWTYQAWNMSYNIAAEQNSQEEAWKWVRQGIELLRDDGLRYNPGDAWIHAELSRIFYQKMCTQLDRNSNYYHRQWALIMSTYLDTGRRAELQAIVDAATSEPELLQRAKCQSLIIAANQIGLNLLDFTLMHDRAAWTDAQRQVILNPAYAESLEQIRLYHVRRELPLKLKLEPAKMLAMDEQYGPLDWRLAEAQTIYWGAPESYTAFFEKPDYESPLIRQAMFHSFMQGTLVYVSDTTYMTSNNLEIAGKFHDYLKGQLTHHRSEGAVSVFKDFHRIAAVLCYSYMYEDMARDLYNEYHDEMLTPEEGKGMTFESFIQSEAPELLQLDRGGTQQTLVTSSLFQAYVWLALGDSYRAKGMEQVAQTIWARDQAANANRPDKQMPPFDELKKLTLGIVLSPNSGVPANVQNTLRAMTGGEVVPIEPDMGKRPVLSLGEDHEAEAADDRAHGAPGKGSK